jgi:hypothetical protein
MTPLERGMAAPLKKKRDSATHIPVRYSHRLIQIEMREEHVIDEVSLLRAPFFELGSASMNDTVEKYQRRAKQSRTFNQYPRTVP